MERIFGAGTDDRIRRIKGFNLLDRDHIASKHPDVEVIVSKHLDQIIGKRIVVIND